jgi:nucleotide-binding universal stress UspA family protein
VTIEPKGKTSKSQPDEIPAIARGTISVDSAGPNQILVPIDFSDGSKKALQYAVHFAKQIRASIMLLHVLPPYSAGDEGYEEESAQRLRAWANEFVPNEIEVQTLTRHGAEAIEIVNEAKKSAVSLMIISTHGRTGRAHALAGSLAENLVQLAPCPVLVVREHEYDFIRTAQKTDIEQTSGFAAPLL